MALAEAAGTLDLPRGELLAFYPLDAGQRWTGALYADVEAATLYVKGAAEEVLGLCSRTSSPAGAMAPAARQEAAAALEQMAAAGKRILAVARRSFPLQAQPENAGVAGRELTLLRFLAFADVLRPEAAAAVAAVHQAGIKVFLATGDHPAAAQHIASQVGIAAGRTLTGAELEQLNPEQ